MRKSLPLSESRDTRYVCVCGLALPVLPTLEGLRCPRGLGLQRPGTDPPLLCFPWGQFYLQCWYHATPRSRPSSPRWMTTAIPSLRTLTSPLALSPKAIFQVGIGGCTGSQEAGMAPFPHPLHVIVRTAGSWALIMNHIPTGNDRWPKLP